MVKLRIASPCSADWNRMQGTDSVRYCPECKLNVYNFSEMGPAEIETLVAAKTGRLCARFYQRADGTMLPQNCPIGFRGTILRASHMAGAALTAILSVAAARSTNAQTPSSASPLVQIRSTANTLTVQVIDATGAVIPNATVSAKKEGTESYTEAVANENGRARLDLQTAARYSVTISAPGFGPRTLKHLSVPFSRTLKVHLEVGDSIMGGVMSLDSPEPPEIRSQREPTLPLVLPEIALPIPPIAPVAPATVTPPLNTASVAAPRSNAIHRFFTKLRRIF